MEPFEQWIIDHKNILSIRSIEVELALPRDTIHKLIRTAVPIPKKWKPKIRQWIVDLMASYKDTGSVLSAPAPKEPFNAAPHANHIVVPPIKKPIDLPKMTPAEKVSASIPPPPPPVEKPIEPEITKEQTNTADDGKAKFFLDNVEQAERGEIPVVFHQFAQEAAKCKAPQEFILTTDNVALQVSMMSIANPAFIEKMKGDSPQALVNFILFNIRYGHQLHNKQLNEEEKKELNTFIALILPVLKSMKLSKTQFWEKSKRLIEPIEANRI